jgi:hypothetical protein
MDTCVDKTAVLLEFCSAEMTFPMYSGKCIWGQNAHPLYVCNWGELLQFSPRSGESGTNLPSLAPVPCGVASSDASNTDRQTDRSTMCNMTTSVTYTNASPGTASRRP